ncbi:MAG: sulfotransferase [Sedimenticolaceae bacterium]
MRPAIVLSEQRTGSNFLLSQLGQHPKIRDFGEVFSKKQVVGCPKGMSKEEYLERKSSDPVGLLKTSIFPREMLDAAGPIHMVKLQYQNIRRDTDGELKDFLQSLHDDLLVIHLVRTNAFDRLVSKINAQKTEKYFVGAKKQKPPEPDPYPITYKEAERGMRKYLRDIDTMTSLIAPFARKITVCYEDLVADRLGELQKIFEFLELEPMRPKVKSVKQSLPARFQIRNYGILRKRFADSPYASFFEESPGY